MKLKNKNDFLNKLKKEHPYIIMGEEELRVEEFKLKREENFYIIGAISSLTTHYNIYDPETESFLLDWLDAIFARIYNSIVIFSYPIIGETERDTDIILYDIVNKKQLYSDHKIFDRKEDGNIGDIFISDKGLVVVDKLTDEHYELKIKGIDTIKRIDEFSFLYAINLSRGRTLLYDFKAQEYMTKPSNYVIHSHRDVNNKNVLFVTDVSLCRLFVENADDTMKELRVFYKYPVYINNGLLVIQLADDSFYLVKFDVNKLSEQIFEKDAKFVGILYGEFVSYKTKDEIFVEHIPTGKLVSKAGWHGSITAAPLSKGIQMKSFTGKDIITSYPQKDTHYRIFEYRNEFGITGIATFRLQREIAL